MAKLSLVSGLIAAFFAVALGAFGAHGLKARVSAEMLDVWETGVTYQFFHALALILLSLWLRQVGEESSWTGWAFIGGILIFSGSLYALVLSGIKIFGAVTPIGGVLFLVGWTLWLIRVVKT